MFRGHRKAILPLLVVIFSLFYAETASSQCGPGKISRTVQGFGSILTIDNAYGGITGAYALGTPDGSGAYFSNNGQYIVIDLIDTVQAGQTYTFFWRQHQSMSGSTIMWWSESVDGVSFTEHSLSGLLTTSNKSFFSSEITAENPTRFLRIYMAAGTNDFYLDAVSYNATKCYTEVCGPGTTSRILSGNALPLSSTDQNGVSNYTNISGVPDGRNATLNSSGDWAIISLPHTIPAGQQYYIIWRPIDVIGVASSILSIE